MRTAEDIIRDYRARGYSNERLRALANGRPADIRDQMLALLDAEAPRDEAEDILNALEADETVEALPPEVAEVTSEEEDDLTTESFELVEEEPSHEEAPEEEAMETATEETAEPEETEQAETDTTPAEPEAEPEAATSWSTDTAFAEVNDILENIETSMAETAAAEAALSHLTDIRVERLSEDQYTLRYPQAESESRFVIDLRGSAAQEAEEETVFADAFGEHWPSVASVDEAQQEVALTAEESSMLIAFHESRSKPASLENLEKHKSGQRSLEVLIEALENDPKLQQAMSEDSNVIELDAPYAIADAFERAPLDILDEDDEVAAQESSLIHFPSDIMPAYEAISYSRDGEVLPIPANDGVFLSDSEIVALEDIRPVEAEEEVAAIEPDVFLAAVTEPEVAEERSWKQGEPDVFLPSTAEAETTQTPAAEHIELEISQLKNWMAELEDECNCKDIETSRLTSMIQERDTTLKMQADEIDRLRDEIHLYNEDAGQDANLRQEYNTLQAQFAEARTRHLEIEREYNILKSETVVELQSDKTDLQTLLEEQSSEQQVLRTSLASSGRRMALSYTVAAAASLLAILMPMLHMIQAGNMEEDFNRQHVALVAENEELISIKDKLEAEIAAVTKTIKQQEQNFATDRLVWQTQENRLEEKLQEKETELASTRRALESRPDIPGTEEVRLANDRAGVSNDSGSGTLRVARNEGITNLEETAWGQEARTSGFIKAEVQRGEGLSEVILRKTGRRGDQTVWDEVARINDIRKSRNGRYYIIHPGQTVKIPKNLGDGTAAASNW